jgi:hypothetical protein
MQGGKYASKMKTVIIENITMRYMGSIYIEFLFSFMSQLQPQDELCYESPKQLDCTRLHFVLFLLENLYR